MSDLLAGLNDNTKADVTDLLGGISDEPADGGPKPYPFKAVSAGDAVQGTVTHRGEYTNTDGKTFPTVLLKSDTAIVEGESVQTTIESDHDGAVRLIGFQKGLREQIEEKDPQPGDRFALKLTGIVPVKSNPGAKFFRYNSAVRKP